MYRRRRMTDGSLKLIETARISLSYTEMTSTLPWHQSVTAFCQWTILSGSYDAFRRSVCSIGALRTRRRTSSRIVPEGCRGVKASASLNSLSEGVYSDETDSGWRPAAPAAAGWRQGLAAYALALSAAFATGACASSGAVPRPFPTPGRDR